MAETTPNISSSPNEAAADEDLIRILVHDSRGQLSALLSVARLLELSPGDVEQGREAIAIIRRQVELLDRKIGQLGRAKSGSPNMGEGDSSIECIPAALPTDQLAKQSMPPQRSLQTLRVLVVDDDRSAAHLLSRLLARLGCNVQAVNSGEAAMQALADFAPQAIITDQEMPGMNGNELALQIRGGAGPRPILIALSGHDPGTPQSPRTPSDFDYVLTKPAGLEALERLLASIRGPSA